MRPRLLWSLGLSAVVSAATALWPASPEPLVAAVESRQAVGRLQNVETNASLGWPSWSLDPAQRDPFAPARTEFAAAQPVVEAPASPIAEQESRMTRAPDYRHLGVLVTPTGERLTWLARGTSPVVASVGSVLDGGYVVRSVEPDGVRLVERGSRDEVLIPVPPREAPR